MDATEERILSLERERNIYRGHFNHAIVCVDKVFQASAQPDTILPDFLEAGECKFEGVIKLAERYKQLLGQNARLREALEEIASMNGERSAMNGSGIEVEIAREALRR